MRATERGIRLQARDRYATRKPGPNGLAFGFGMIGADRIDEAVRRLARAIP